MNMNQSCTTTEMKLPMIPLRGTVIFLAIAFGIASGVTPEKGIITAIVAWLSYAPLKKYWHGEDLPKAR